MAARFVFTFALLLVQTIVRAEKMEFSVDILPSATKCFIENLAEGAQGK